MTHVRLSFRDRRALTVGAVALVLLVAVPRGSRAWLAWRANAIQAAAEMTHELIRAKTTIAGLPIALDSAEVRVARVRQFGTMLLVARKPAEAAASLAAAVREAAGPSVRLMSLESRTDSVSRSTLHRVSTSVHANGDITGLAAMLMLLEGHWTMLAIRTLSVHPQSIETPQETAELLDIRFTVEARAVIAADRK